MHKILNKKNLKIIDPSTMIYIGRPYGSSLKHFGNPFSHIANSQAVVIVKTRREAVDAHWQWLIGERYQDVEPERRQWILDHLYLLENRDMVCWCSPLRCHGENYLRLLERNRDGKLSMSS